MSGDRLAKITRTLYGENPDAGPINVTVQAGPRGTKRIVPPAGEDYAFDVPQWARTVTVYVSPTGRSARVWVDGVEIPKDHDAD